MSLFKRRNGTREYDERFVATAQSTPLFDKTAHSRLTEACRAVSGYGDSKPDPDSIKNTGIKEHPPVSVKEDVSQPSDSAISFLAAVVEVEEDALKFLNAVALELNSEWEKKGHNYRMRVFGSTKLVVYPISEPAPQDVLQLGTTMVSEAGETTPECTVAFSNKSIQDRVDLEILAESTRKRTLTEAEQAWKEAQNDLLKTISAIESLRAPKGFRERFAQWRANRLAVEQDGWLLDKLIGSKQAGERTDRDFMNIWTTAPEEPKEDFVSVPVKVDIQEKISRLKANPVFLGGTCNGSLWRDALIPMLNVPHFNPVVEDWSPEDICKEEFIKANAPVIVYGITSSHIGFYSFAELATNIFRNRDKMIVVAFLDHDGEFTKHQVSANAATESLLKNEVNAFFVRRLEEVALLVNSWSHRSTNN